MSHEIGKFDKHQGIEQAWHNKTEVHPEWKDLPVATVLAACFLSTWDIVKRVLYRRIPVLMSIVGIKIPDTNEQFVETETCELTCTDNPEIIIGKPVHCQTYTVLTNAKFLKIIADTAAKLPGAFVASVLSCCDRARIAVALSIPRELNPQTFADNALSVVNGAMTLTLNAANREFQFYLNFLSSHDKSAPFTVVLSTVCTVCNNTFNCNLLDRNDKRLRISIAHTKNMETALADVPEIVAAAFVTAEKFVATMQTFAAIAISENDARAFFTGFLSAKDANEEESAANDSERAIISARRANQIARLVELFQTGKGNVGQNLADVFSAVTDYYSHESSGGEDTFKQIASSEFGNGAAMKAFAFAVLQDEKKRAKLICDGQKLLADAERVEKEKAAKANATK